jgi:hypothetical protein
MRRFSVSGLVPCAPVALADQLLDTSAAPQIWPEDAGAGPAPLDRLRRVSPVEVHERSATGVTVHRFLPASGGCLWSIESHARRRAHESWERFVRRREQERAQAMRLVDTAAGYFAGLL